MRWPFSQEKSTLAFAKLFLPLLLAGVAASANAHSFQKWELNGPAEPQSITPLPRLIEQYQGLTSLQQEEKNKSLAASRSGYWVTDVCRIEDARASDEYSTLQSKGFEVDCVTNNPFGTKAVLYFPESAQSLIGNLAKHQRVEFKGIAAKVDGFSSIKQAYVRVTSLSPQGQGPAVKATSAPAAVPQLKGTNAFEMRRLLIAAGWSPRETFGKNYSGESYRAIGHAGSLLDGGIIEVQQCAGTGSGGCIYNYVKGDACLRVFTAGDYAKEGKTTHYPAYVGHKAECPTPEEIGKK